MSESGLGFLPDLMGMRNVEVFWEGQVMEDISRANLSRSISFSSILYI